MSRRKICVVSATRAEWGLLRNLCKEINADKDLKLQLIVTAAHLSADFGLTYKEIEKEFKIDKKIPILLASDDKISICKAMGLGFVSFSEAFETLKPDIVVILGDRYEMLCVASVCLMMKIPIAHLYGGELTLGAIDDSIRHAISKMASLHFAGANEYKNRVLQLGEEPWRVFNVGSLGGENIQKLKLLSKKELERELEFKFDKKIYLITYHPETLTSSSLQKEVKSLLQSLDKFKSSSLIFTKANADENGIFINEALKVYCDKNPHKAKLFDSLGTLKYLSLMKITNAVVGNSSSGLIETPFFKTPCINIGSRQNGRLRAANIIDVSMSNLQKGFERLESKEFKESLKTMKNPFESKNPSFEIKQRLKNADLSVLINKNFVDLRSGYEH
ncbi:UDP-N-acetylglucosamine 2-epimerase (hydrolyzing) [Campylobacter sp. MIT 99-7217]|uniref:UDP-N-acetylglucosamine 2-epimerase n=1 Tax=Campylobacter sp. MIT 99-7217 TaxID=535091 RepID=UPI00115B8A9F|nr:UDP-N-acetylglucosamine 2-epimerase [Campylobacter sp. MIT 99-7217]TQR33816.1 UDP-N-acetylglucosamine 2-epimerase (hydrolyzing) [Campylobacter sp. MIT 99-7217]